MRARALLLSVATTVLFASGCAAGGSARTADPTPAKAGATHAEHEGMSMVDMGSGAGPSQAARMICGDEIRKAVQRTFGLPREPSPTHSWSTSTRVFSCLYRLSGGALRLTVDDAADDRTGRRDYARLRSSLPGAVALRGMQSFGLPGFQTPTGDVVFIKDGKTLRVDATGLTAAGLPEGFSRVEAAYSVASSVVACWKE